jgi:hypothetical protein
MGLPIWPEDGLKNAAGTSKLPPWPFAITRPKTEIDLRAEMKLMLEGNEYYPRRGHWVLLRRMDTRQRCFCWNQKPEGDDKYNEDKGKYNEPKLRCPICNGEGWVYEDELHLMRRRLVSPAIGLAESEHMADIGWMNINYIVFYTQWFVNPDKGDKIIEIELNDDDATPVRPYVRKEMYRIAVAEPFRDQLGRIEYWRIAAKLEVV